MKDLRILNFFPQNFNDFEALDIAGSSHDNGKSENGDTQKREKFILINSIFVERVIGKLAFSNFDSSQVLDMIFDDSDNSLISCSSISK